MGGAYLKGGTHLRCRPPHARNASAFHHLCRRGAVIGDGKRCTFRSACPFQLYRDAGCLGMFGRVGHCLEDDFGKGSSHRLVGGQLACHLHLDTYERKGAHDGCQSRTLGRTT